VAEPAISTTVSYVETIGHGYVPYTTSKLRSRGSLRPRKVVGSKLFSPQQSLRQLTTPSVTQSRHKVRADPLTVQASGRRKHRSGTIDEPLIPQPSSLTGLGAAQPRTPGM
jgi:hypothetical protein